MKTLNVTLVGGIVILGSLLPAPAVAQQDGNEVQLEEIVVTARKREESVLETPVSISVFSSEVIERASMQSLEDVAALTPGLTFNSYAAGNYAVPTIRGMARADITDIEDNVSACLNGGFLPDESVRNY